MYCVYCIGCSKTGGVVESTVRKEGGTGVSQDEHVAGEVAAVVAKLEQKETELHEVSER